jgi:hypothetical protein
MSKFLFCGIAEAGITSENGKRENQRAGSKVAVFGVAMSASSQQSRAPEKTKDAGWRGGLSAHDCSSPTAFSCSSVCFFPGRARSAAATCDLSKFRPSCFLR